jgi:hypothetical protein
MESEGLNVGTEDHLPEEPELTGTTLRDPFWQAVNEARYTETDACERTLLAQTEQDKAWHQKTKDRLMADGLTGAEFDSAFTTETQAYFYRSRSRCVCGDHLPDGLRS